MARLREWARAPLGAGVIFLVLLSMVWLGMRVPGFGWLTPFGGGSGLNLSAPPLGEFAPLRESFVSTVLGAQLPRQAHSPQGLRPSSRGTPLGELGPQIVEHALTNDQPGSAYAVERVPFSARSDTSEALRAGDPSDCAPIGGTVYYRYTPAANGGLVATTAAGGPIALAVYADEVTPSSRAIECGSDPQGRARVQFPALAGITYFFQITMQIGGPLVFSLNRESTTIPVTILPDGSHAGYNRGWGLTRVSANGRYVVFTSDSPRLDPRCPCGPQVYVRDLVTGVNELVSITVSGGIPNQGSSQGGISADGRFVVWETRADNVAPNDAPDTATQDLEADVFVRDRLMDRTERITVAEDGSEINGQWPSMSADGRYVTFSGDWQHRSSDYNTMIKDVWIKDRKTGTVTLASRTDEGVRGNHDSQDAMISPDGRYVSFWSRASSLLPGQAALEQHAWNKAGVWRAFVYVFDMKKRSLSIECVSETGELADQGCHGHSLSAGGRYSIFYSAARNLMPLDPPAKATGYMMYLYRRDRMTGRLQVVTTAEDGSPVGEPYLEKIQGVPLLWRDPHPSISWDGNVVAFDTVSALVGGDTNELSDVYIKDYGNEGRVIRLSEAPLGTEPNGPSEFPILSADGSVAAFISGASNLTDGDTNQTTDAFVRFWRIS